MRKLLVFLALGLLGPSLSMTLSGQMIKNPPGAILAIDNVTFVPPSGQECAWKWYVVVKNTGREVSPATPPLGIQAYQLDGQGNRKAAGGEGLGQVPAGGTSSSQPIPFTPWPYGLKLLVLLNKSGVTISQKTIDLPVLQATVDLVNFRWLPSGEYEITVRNLSSHSISDLGFQTFQSINPPRPDNAWMGTGGYIIPCLPGRGNKVFQMKRYPKCRHLRIELRRGDTVYLIKKYEM